MLHPARAWALLVGGLVIRTLGVLMDQHQLTLWGAVLEWIGGVSVAIDFAQLLAQRSASGKQRDPAILVAVGLAAIGLPVGLGADTLGVAGVSLVGSQIGVLMGDLRYSRTHGIDDVRPTLPALLSDAHTRTARTDCNVLLECGRIDPTMCGLVIGQEGIARLGGAVQGVGILGALVALRLLESRRVPTGFARLLWRDPTAWMGAIAYGWFAVVAVLVMCNAVVERRWAVALERHLLGVGYVLTLIFAVGSHLLLGCAGQRLRVPHGGWLLLAAALGMTSLRSLAALTAGYPSVFVRSLADLPGMAAMAVFA